MFCEYFKVNLPVTTAAPVAPVSPEPQKQEHSADHLIKQHPERSWILPAASELLIPQ